ncbi:hypothetical protein [Streptomyces noursei]|uniref:Uncharacterized protein n=1 Tax=Streptomyces noursei TaxID=1971 RepID=A0A059WFE3_STRNR|nr:hypothetical protein [Streptomyces noursei]AIA06567.1 hypothetical protein DC74_6126 [Streptomyces noursei]UWS74986.1 hypothetical protein N1H47_29340 [Streptomyces noursei]GCB94220.1 hypothetical protein SALB_07018 [Streptomyces noursei]
MDTATTVALSSACLTALVALVGYWVTQHIKRRETKSQMYAQALQVIHDYQELPYLICHRADSEPATRSALAKQISDVFARLHLYQTLLALDSPVVSDAYIKLFSHTRRQGGPHRHQAWNTPPAAADSDMTRSAHYYYDNVAQLEACLLAMRRELRPWGWTQRRDTRKKVINPDRSQLDWRRPQAISDDDQPSSS